MKIRFLIAACFAFLVGLPADSRAVLPPRQPALPNFDKRVEAIQQNGGAPAQQPALAVQNQSSASSRESLALQAKAEADLKTRVQGLKVERDPILGMPRFISATRGFLTGPEGKGAALTPQAVDAIPATDPHRPIKAFLNAYAPIFGHNAAALEAARIKRDYVTEHNGLRTVIWEQMVDGIPVFEGLLAGHVTKKGELVNISSRFVPDPAQAARLGTPNRAELIRTPFVSAKEAIAKAAANLGTELDESSLVALGEPDGAESRQAFTAPLLRGEARVKLVWLPLNRNSLRLAWRVELCSRARPELYSVVVDAQTGEAMLRRSLTSYLTDASYRVYTSDSPSPFSPGFSTPTNTQPPVVQRKLVKLSAISTNASPNGWINDADNETRGNNVDAHTDRNDDDQADLPRPQGSPKRVFDFPLDLTTQPTTYTNAAVVNLFYWNNFMHDKLWELGFTEAAGNFQNTNFDRGGQGNDAVQADAQDGGGFDNANFQTPPDGEPGRMQMYIWSGPDPNRDGDLDAEIMCHEYTHGLSNRLVGGDVGISELQPSGMGEGWSDFYGLSLLSESTDDVHGNYAAGAYALYKLDNFTQNYYFGIRRYPYTTDMTKNPLTFRDIDPSQANAHPGIPLNPVFGGSPADEVHAQGEIWCVTLWEARANLIDKLGFAEGNKTILQLVTDGMKLSPANPTFLEARDAILQADEINSGGDNRSELWIAFAKRGMGFSATAPSSDTTIGVGEAFDLPDDVLIGSPDGQLEVTITPHTGAVVFAGTTEPIFVRVTDGIAVTNATITATVTGGGALVFKNDGVDPDKTANNSVYSGSLSVPTTTNTVTITLVITAPDKDTSTNVVTYSIIPIPPNDNFANAIKVPSAGAVYLSNNKLATVEPDEPKHGGLPKPGASLWWLYSASSDTDLLIDTAGSAFDTVIAVYTGSSLKTLQSVISADNVGKRKQAFLTLHATKGIAYRVAVASANTNGTGTLNLRFAPGGQPDLNPPVVTVTSPPSGLVLATNRVVVTGTAFDPQPFASGIDEILIRVNTVFGPGSTDQTQTENGSIASAAAAGPNIVLNTNWFRIVALREGLNLIQVTANDIAGNLSDPISLEVTYRPLDPLNDIFANAIPLTQASGTNVANTARATKEFGEPLHANNEGGKSVWWSFRAAADGVLSLTTTNSNFDTLLAVYTGSRVSALTAVAANDDAFDGSGFSQVELGVTANQTYHIAVDGFGGASGVAYLEYSFSSSSLFSLSVSNTVGGTVNIASALVKGNTTVVLIATPDVGFDFIGWEGSVNSQENPLSVIVTSNMSLVARFAPHVFSDDFQSGGLTHLPWTTSGDAPWRVETAAPRSGPGTGSGAARQLPANYVPNRPFIVAITVTPAASVTSYSVSDQPPLDWVVSSIDNNGTFNVTARRVTWGPFFDHQQRTLTYRVLPPNDAVGVVSFNGTATLDGVSSPIAGDLDTAVTAARSGQIADNQESSLILAKTVPAGSASFDLRVSSEEGWDFLEFSINDVLVQRWSGEVGWQAYQFEVPAGTTKLVWRYRKDRSISKGLDAAFIDNLQLPAAGGPVSVSQLRLTSGPSADGAVRVQLRGQSGQAYAIQASSDLVQWESIGNGVAIDGVIAFVDIDAGKHSLRYYRAVAR